MGSLRYRWHLTCIHLRFFRADGWMYLILVLTIIILSEEMMRERKGKGGKVYFFFLNNVSEMNDW